MNLSHEIAGPKRVCALIKSTDRIGRLRDDSALAIDERNRCKVGAVRGPQQRPAQGQDQRVAGVNIVGLQVASRFGLEEGPLEPERSELGPGRALAGRWRDPKDAGVLDAVDR